VRIPEQSGRVWPHQLALAAAAAALALWPRPAAAPPNAAEIARQVMASPDVVYSTHVVWECSARTWERALDHPLVMGALWRAYGFAPAYAISGRPDSLHVFDPTGLVGDAFPCARTTYSVQYLVLGKLNHWAVPVLNKGLAVFAVVWRDTGSGIDADATVYVQAGSGIAGLLLRLVRPLLAAHVENRISHNVRDAQRIVADIERDPARVASRLEGGLRDEFAQAFGGR